MFGSSAPSPTTPSVFQKYRSSCDVPDGVGQMRRNISERDTIPRLQPLSEKVSFTV